MFFDVQLTDNAKAYIYLTVGLGSSSFGGGGGGGGGGRTDKMVDAHRKFPIHGKYHD